MRLGCGKIHRRVADPDADASQRHTFSAGMSIQRRSFQLLWAASTSCRPLAPSSSVHLNGASSYEVPDEHLPLGLEAVVVDAEARHLLPRLEELDRLRHVRIPHRPRRVDPRLAPALLQARHRRAVRAVDMERHEIVAPHPRAPGHVDVRDHAALELEGRIGGVVDVVGVGLAVLVPALRDMRRAEAGDALDIAEQVVEHVAPVAHHVEDDAAALRLLVVPRRPLRRLPVALEHPVAELAAHREDAAEEAGVDQHLELEQARQEQLVLHHAVLDAGLLRGADEIERVLQRLRHRLLAIDVLAGLHRLLAAARREAAWWRHRRTTCPSCP